MHYQMYCYGYIFITNNTKFCLKITSYVKLYQIVSYYQPFIVNLCKITTYYYVDISLIMNNINLTIQYAYDWCKATCSFIDISYAYYSSIAILAVVHILLDELGCLIFGAICVKLYETVLNQLVLYRVSRMPGHFSIVLG